MGIGHSRGHFGEILQGYFRDISGTFADRACVTLPVFDFPSNSKELASENGKMPKEYQNIMLGQAGASALFVEDKTSKIIRLSPQAKNKILSHQAVVKLLGKGRSVGGTLYVFSRAQVSRGMGSSTSDIVASLRAVSDCFQLNLSRDKIASIAVSVEGASDGIMYENANLFVTTQSRILHDFITLFPAVECLGFDSWEQKPSGIDTDKIGSRNYTDEELDRLSECRSLLIDAFLNRDLRIIGEVATISAKINQRFLYKPLLHQLIKLKDRYGALGVVVAHSGTMQGLLFEPNSLPDNSTLRKLKKEIKGLGISNIYRYSCGTSISSDSRFFDYQ